MGSIPIAASMQAMIFGQPRGCPSCFLREMWVGFSLHYFQVQ
jgi:dipeptide/tripeptide permease